MGKDPKPLSEHVLRNGEGKLPREDELVAKLNQIAEQLKSVTWSVQPPMEQAY
jgi:hypothetical protein